MTWHPPPQLYRFRFAYQTYQRADGWGRIVAGFVIPQGPSARGKQPEIHDFYSLHYILSGTAISYDLQGQTHPLAAGDFHHLYPETNTPGHHTLSADFLEAVMIIDQATYRQCRALGMLTFDNPVGHAGIDPAWVQTFDGLLTRLNSVEPVRMDDYPLAQALALISQLHDRARTSSRLQDPLLREACRLLEAHLDEKLALAAVATAVGLSYEAFRKAFRQALGMPAGEYRLRARLQAARDLLGQGLQVQQVAARLGYCDPFVFSQQFKQYLGVSPRGYQRALRG